jgi:hypothetical protein
MLDESVSFTAQFIGGTVQTQGVTIAVGQSKTIEVDLFIDGPTSGPRTVAAYDALAKYLGGSASLDFQWDRTQGRNGDKLHLTVTLKAADATFGGAHPFVVTSTLGSAQTAWAGLVVE